MIDLSNGELDLQFFIKLRSHLRGGCSRTIEESYGMMRLESFLYALDQVNANSSLLFGHKLGAVIHDSCKNPNKELICSVGLYDSIIGLVGPERSDPVNIGSVIYSSFYPKFPMVTYGGTSDSLQDKEQYPNLFQTVPSDTHMVDALSDIASFYNWTFIGVLYSFENMGNGINELRSAASKKGICIKFSIAMKKTLNDAFFQSALKPLQREKDIKVVFLLLSDVEAQAFLLYASKRQSDFSRLQFVCSQHLGTKLSVLPGNKSIDVGLITLEVESAHVPDFEKYFLSLRPATNSRNPSFGRYWEQVFNCSLNLNATGGTTRCKGNETLKEGRGYFSNAPVIPIIDAVFAYAHAVSLSLQDRCSHLGEPSRKDCLANKSSIEMNINGSYLQEMVIAKLPTVNFTFPIGHRFEFDSYRRQKLNYSIYNTQADGNGVRFVNVGTWRNIKSKEAPRFSYKDRLTVNTSLVRWRLNSTPLATCGKQCSVSETRLYDRVFPCCWSCIPCQTNAIIVNNTCIACRAWTKKDAAGRKCITMPVTVIDTSSAFPILVIVLVTCWSVVVLLILAIYMRHFNSQPIKATSRELSLVSLMGLLAMFCTPLAFLARPSSVVCNLQQCLFGTSLTLCSVPLFLKALVLFRVVRKAKKSVTSPRLSNKRSQFLICAGLIFIQILLSALWLQGNPGIVQKYISTDKSYVITHCKYEIFSLVVNFIYPCIIMGLATVFALRTAAKNLPATVFEGKRIALTSALTCFIIFLYLVSFTVYVNNKNSFIQEYSISLTYLIIGAVNVSCVFFPRIALVFKPAPEVLQPRPFPIIGNYVEDTPQSMPAQKENRLRIFEQSKDEPSPVPDNSFDIGSDVISVKPAHPLSK